MTPARQTAAYDRHVLGPSPAERARHAARELTEAELYAQLQAELRASAQELLRDPATLARGLDSKFRMRPHVRAISDAFVDVANGHTQKVMLLTPPQVGKSTVAAVWAPFWWLAKNPDHRIIVACYGSSLANARGRSVRKLVREHGSEYDLEMDPGSGAVNDWLLNSGGGMRSVGIGGSITGHSADCVTGETELVTTRGRVTVGRFVRSGAHVPVLAWDHEAGRAVFRRVEATRVLRARPVMRLETVRGRVLRCTPDHLVWAPGRGYVAAGRLRSRDVLQGVQVGGHERLVPEWDVITSVRYSRDAERVYDLQVAGTRNFFAGGLLVHNCLIIDDPHKNRQEADSHAMREAVHDSYSADLTSRLAPGAPTVLIQCIVASMRVLRGDGRWVAVEKMKAGDTVVSLAEDRKSLRTAKVLGQRLSGYDETVTVRTGRLALKVNKAHPFAVLNRERKTPGPASIEWVKAGELREGDRVVTAKCLPDDYVGTDVLPDGSEVTEELAWLLGYMLGDGWVAAHRRKNQRGNPTSFAVCASVGKSSAPEKQGLNERVKAALEAFSPNRVYETSGRYLRTDWNAGGRLLREMGYGLGARGKRVPDCVWGWSPHLRRSLIRGYAMADGSKRRANGSKAWRVGSVSRDLLQDIRDLALTCGVRPTTIFTDRERFYQPPNSPEPVRSIGHSLGLTFNPDQAEGTTHLADRKHPDPSHLRYERVTAIEEGPVLPVYDLAVEGSETFIAEGYAVHNTRWHPDDLAGRLLEEEGDDREGGEWRVVHMPALADLSLTGGSDPLGRATGDPLPHPKIPTREKARLRTHWEKKKAGSKARDWGALYQGDPQPGEGALADEELMRQILDLRPEAEPVKVAVAVDPSGGGEDNAGIIGGFLGDDQRVYWTHDRSAVMSSDDWSRTACRLAWETDASVIVCETNFGGDMCLLAIRTAWDALQREGVIPEEKLPPQVKAVQAKVGKLLRAEPILQQMVEDRVRLAARLQSLIHQWTHWQPTNPDSPGELDAAVYLVYALLRVPGAGAVMSSPAQVHQRQVAAGGWTGMPAQRPLPQGPIP
ncbi:LAGLIDADG family homing endonuclease [Streptomyces sp. TR02-1]|uniref:LAGLIDADG family homing endonuclease n=1 Tax=Streptomyces sp. TR02-1 TaxID=3385977 RepID=UPI0039A38B51